MPFYISPSDNTDYTETIQKMPSRNDAAHKLKAGLDALDAHLTALEAVLAIVFPAIPDQTKPERFDVQQQTDSINRGHIFNPRFPTCLQVFGVYKIPKAYEVGSDSATFGHLAPLLLTQSIPPSPYTDYKAYCCNFGTRHESILGIIDDPGNRYLKRDIGLWIKQCMHDLQVATRNERPTACIFRRSLIVRLSTYWQPDAHYCGHAITLALEAPLTKHKNDGATDQSNPLLKSTETESLTEYPYDHRQLRLMILEYRMHEYVYNVHDRIFQWMKQAITESPEFIPEFFNIHTETICLKGMLHINEQFMTCMSVAFRTVVYLATARTIPGDTIHESDSDFVLDSASLEHHVARMLNWGYSNRDLISHKSTILISPEMAQPIFELCNASCYLLLVPGDTPVANKSDYLATIKAIANAKPAPITLRYNAGTHSPVFI